MLGGHLAALVETRADWRQHVEDKTKRPFLAPSFSALTQLRNALFIIRRLRMHADQAMGG
jgi:hypothetical protein